MYIISFRIFIKINPTDSTSFLVSLPGIQSELLPILLSGNQDCHSPESDTSLPTKQTVRQQNLHVVVLLLNHYDLVQLTC